ncbi:unnamed protein product [Cochlearia groenlandica]
MSQTMEEYQSKETQENTSLKWSKAISVGKKVLATCVLLSSAPFIVPTILFAFLVSVPFCFFLATYAFTQKLMSSLLPPTQEKSVNETNEYEYEYSKLDESSLIETMDDKEMAKESTSLIEKLRDEGETDKRTSNEKDYENLGDDKSEKAQEETKEDEADKSRREGLFIVTMKMLFCLKICDRLFVLFVEEIGGVTSETSRGKEEETSSNEPKDQDVRATHGTGEDKQKSINKKKKKSGRAGNMTFMFWCSLVY